MKIATWLFLLIPLLLSACGLIRIQSIDALEAETEARAEPAPINFHNQSAPVEPAEAEPIVQTPVEAPQVELLSDNSSFPEVIDSSSSVQELYDIEQEPLFIPSPPGDELALLTPEVEALPAVEASEIVNLPEAQVSESLPVMPESPAASIAPNILIESQMEDEADTAAAEVEPVEQPAGELEPAAPVIAAPSTETPSAEVPSTAAPGIETPSAQVDSNASDSDQSATSHLVVSGDTVFSISQRYGKSVAQIAEINNISAPGYLIYPGTELQLQAPSAEPVEQYTSYEVVSGDTVYSIAQRYQMTPEQLAGLNNISIPEYTIYPKTILKVNNVEPSAETNTSSNDQQPAVTNSAPQPDWQWPIIGAVQQSRLQNLPGILISSELAAPVQATSSGKVVFAGDKIRPIGLMIIIEHSNSYLSVYGNLQQLLVEENDSITAGQRLGDLDNSAQLYFEIRRGSQYIDPRELLPEL